MKKLLLVLLVCLSSTIVLAQKATTLHWTSVPIGNTTMTMAAVLVIDGTEQFEDALNLELGVFDQNEICRGTKLPKKKASTGRYIYSISIRGEEGLTYHCRVWDHANDAELDITYVPSTTEPIVFETNHTFGSSANPYEVNFVSAVEPIEVTKHIVGHGGNGGGFYLLATPVVGQTPADIENMIAENELNYDLYMFDASIADDEWQNYKQHSDNFPLEPGRGYLYSNRADVDLTFAGTPYTGESTIMLSNTGGTPYSGWNLVGNPFNYNITTNKDYYVMNETRDELVAVTAGTAIAPMEGFLVYADTDQENLVLTPSITKGASPVAVFNLNSESKNIDRAIVSFGDNSLRKLQLNASHTKLYIPQDGTDYAIAAAEADNDMPLNFRAETAGQYTISFSNSADLGYMHLFDKVTGDDIDMLAEGAYSFVGSPRDREDRFVVRFSDGSDMFVYQSGSDLIVSGNGTLQVFDVMGRFVASYEVSGIQRIGAEQFANAVYVFRMVGSDVKTQKIVVR